MNPRMRRLQSDWEEVRAAFSGHPHVTVQPSGPRQPPERYHVVFRLRGLWLDGHAPAYRDEHEVEILLPREYPSVKPYCVPLTPVFHPNIRDYFCLNDHWAAGMTLVDVIAKLGDMIQWIDYNPQSPLDGFAAGWALEQQSTGMFPLGRVQLGLPDVEVTRRSSTDDDDIVVRRR
jgi:ubiquitin-protein ligase